MSPKGSPKARTLPGTEPLLEIHPGSKLFLHLDHSTACIYEHDLEQSAVYDIGLLKRRETPEWVLQLEKLFVPHDIFACHYWGDAINPAPPDWDDDDAVAELDIATLLVSIFSASKTEEIAQRMRAKNKARKAKGEPEAKPAAKKPLSRKPKAEERSKPESLQWTDDCVAFAGNGREYFIGGPGLEADYEVFFAKVGVSEREWRKHMIGSAATEDEAKALAEKHFSERG